MKNILIILFLSIIVMSCGNKLEKEEAFLDSEIHRLHDVETMPHITKMHKLTKELREVGDSLEILPLITALEKADETMFDWMDQFNWQSEATPIEDRIKYYKKEVKKLEEMEVLIDNAMENAQNYIDSKK